MTTAPTIPAANASAGPAANASAGQQPNASGTRRMGVGKVIAIDDDPMTLRLLTGHLSKAGHPIDTANNGADGLELIDEATAVALVDLRMPDLSGFEVLRHLQRYHPTTRVIVLTGSDDVSDAVKAMREGAFQFITKPFDPDQLIVNVEKAIESWRLADENRDLKEAHSHNVPVRLAESSGDMHSRLMQQVDRIASLDSTVFIGGESGTGKSTIARMIHQSSSRSKGPFVTVNCASLPRDLIQSELFGHTKGSFTGAVKDRIGHAEVADRGTLFLDEIGDLPMELQPKLLTFLQDRTVQRLGSEKSKTVDVRLMAASHRDLAEMCREGLFRQDLYFRLMVLNLELPSLRYRTGEFDNIAIGILAAICERQAIAMKSIDEHAMRLLKSHPWPGNIRELENVLMRAVAFSDDTTVGPDDLHFSNVSLESAVDLSPRVGATYAIATGCPTDQPTVSSAPLPIQDQATDLNESTNLRTTNRPQGYTLAGKTLAQIERDAIIQTLTATGGNKARTARSLGISEKSIYNKMRRLNIQGDFRRANSDARHEFEFEQ